MSKTYRKFRGIDDRTLGAALTNHAQVLQGVAQAVEVLLRERRLNLVWGALVTLVVMWAAWLMAVSQAWPWRYAP